MTSAEESKYIILPAAVVAISIAVVLSFSNISFSWPSFGSKWMKGTDLVQSAERDLPEAQALIASFDKDNGKIYCVPKMSGAELGEFRAKIPGLMIGNVFKGAFSGEGMKDFNQDKPIESVLRMTFTKSYPCK
jgi:hypothetical protein